MDNLTHSLVGAALSRTGLQRATPLATATLVLAANAPDVDMLAYVRGGYFALAFRRGITHGLPALVVLPFAVAGVMLAWDRWVRRRRDPGAEPARFGALLLLSAIGLVTHPVLDWMNTYGMRWWLPFDGRWSYGDALFIIDPWLWLSLGGGVYLTGTWSRRGTIRWMVLLGLTTALIAVAPVALVAKVAWVGGAGVLVILAHGRPPGIMERRWRLGRGVVVWCTAYILAMVASDLLARREVRKAVVAAGLGEPEAVMVAPLPAAPLRAEVLVLTDDGYAYGSHRWDARPPVELEVGSAIPRLAAGEGVSQAEAERAAAAARQAPDARHFLVWSRFPAVRVERGDGGDGYSVRISDLRYAGRGAGELGGLVVRLDGGYRVVGGG
ncbi:MAG TPA: metal-dependent hydrolase [Longimicrobiales bacterium]